MQDTKQINIGLGDNPASLYHCIRGFINYQQWENIPNETLKLRRDNIYETMELDGGENIPRSDQLIKVAVDQA